ncbi:unnamed protein product [Gordionus sp. m RMFG-2023]
MENSLTGNDFDFGAPQVESKAIPPIDNILTDIVNLNNCRLSTDTKFANEPTQNIAESKIIVDPYLTLHMSDLDHTRIRNNESKYFRYARPRESDALFTLYANHIAILAAGVIEPAGDDQILSPLRYS